ncbi:MAG: hypothetical protein ACD_45C00744G0001 [uncultured bacterium]|nr:MAG: hypothetical protein ACD_45C00744G0001 [uncultured bacterium]
MQTQQPLNVLKIDVKNITLDDEARLKKQSQLACFQTLIEEKTEGSVINIVDIDKVLSQLRSTVETMVVDALKKDKNYQAMFSELIEAIYNKGESLLSPQDKDNIIKNGQCVDVFKADFSPEQKHSITIPQAAANEIFYETMREIYKKPDQPKALKECVEKIQKNMYLLIAMPISSLLEKDLPLLSGELIAETDKIKAIMNSPNTLNVTTRRDYMCRMFYDFMKTNGILGDHAQFVGGYDSAMATRFLNPKDGATSLEGGKVLAAGRNEKGRVLAALIYQYLLAASSRNEKITHLNFNIIDDTKENIDQYNTFFTNSNFTDFVTKLKANKDPDSLAVCAMLDKLKEIQVNLCPYKPQPDNESVKKLEQQDQWKEIRKDLSGLTKDLASLAQDAYEKKEEESHRKLTAASQLFNLQLGPVSCLGVVQKTVLGGNKNQESRLTAPNLFNQSQQSLRQSQSATSVVPPRRPSK